MTIQQEKLMTDEKIDIEAEQETLESVQSNEDGVSITDSVGTLLLAAIGIGPAQSLVLSSPWGRIFVVTDEAKAMQVNEFIDTLEGKIELPPGCVKNARRAQTRLLENFLYAVQKRRQGEQD